MKFRVVRVFGNGITPSTAKAYKVESVETMTEGEAFKLLKDLGSPYSGSKYEVAVGTEVKTRTGVFPSIPCVKQEDESWRPKYDA